MPTRRARAATGSSRSTTPTALRAALDAALGTLAVVEKERHLLLWQSVRIHLDQVKGLGSSSSSRASRPPTRTCAPSASRSRACAEALAIGRSGSSPTPTPTRCSAPTRWSTPRRARDGARHAPYSRYRVGAALRAEDGSIHVGANVENAAYPQGQCAEASAIGALVAAGRTRIARGRGDRRRRRICVPCGGCRQRLREFMPLGADDPPLLRRPARARRRRSRSCCRARSDPEFLPG